MGERYEKSSKQWVVCAAIKFSDGHVALGARHYSPLMRANLIEKYGDDVKQWPQEREQGFITKHDIFISREDAAKMALESGQMDTLYDALFSEDLY